MIERSAPPRAALHLTSVMAVALGAFTLWDFYVGSFASGYRVFDLAATALVLGTTAAIIGVRGVDAVGRARAAPARWVFFATIPALFVIGAMIGIAADIQAARPSVGVMLGLFAWLMFHTWDVSPRTLRRLLTALILVHVVALLLQLVIYRGTGFLVNYHAATGGIPRVFAASLFRPAGLFLEPSSYSVSLIMLLLLRIRLSRAIDAVDLLGFATILSTISLFGFLAVIAVAAFLFWRRMGFWVVAVLAMLGAQVYLQARADLTQRKDFVVARLTNLARDASVLRRLGNMFLTQDPSTSWGFWFGHGVSNEYTAFGASGLGYLMHAVGLVGLVAFVIATAFLAPRGSRAHVTFAVVLCLVAAPMWTMMLWWAWLGLLTNNAVPAMNATGRYGLQWRTPAFGQLQAARA